MAREPEAVTELRHALGRQLATFRQAAGLTQGQLAARVFVDRTTVAHLEGGKGSKGSRDLWKALDTALDAGGVLLRGYLEVVEAREARERHSRDSALAQARVRVHQFRHGDPSAGSSSQVATGDHSGGVGVAPAVCEVDRLAAEIVESATADGAISQLGEVTVSLAESHTHAPAHHVLTQVFHLHRQAQILLGGKQRLSQKRELFRIESDLLAHACLLLDDVKQTDVAYKYGALALSFAQEAGTGQATARTALAKTLRWADRLIESADMAKAGYECSPSTPVRIQLASQEANAAALMGNTTRAREALTRAEAAAETVTADSGTSAWSFPVGRQAIFAFSVALATGDPDAALRAVTMADAHWASGAALIPANWAQIRVGAALAHLAKGALDMAVSEVTPVLDLAPELRIATVTAYMDKLDRQLSQPRFTGNRDAAELRQSIHDFTSTALHDNSSVVG